MCENWAYEINVFTGFEDLVKYSDIINYMFPDESKENGRESHTTVVVNMACALDKIFQDIDGWYIGKMQIYVGGKIQTGKIQTMPPEICIFKAYKNVEVISHDYFDGKRMSGILERCMKKDKKRCMKNDKKRCIEEIIRAFKTGSVVCLDYGQTKPVECYLLNEISEMTHLNYSNILSEIDKGNLIVRLSNKEKFLGDLESLPF